MARKINYTPYILGAIALYFAPTIADIFASGATSQNTKIAEKEKKDSTKKIIKQYKDKKTGKVIAKKEQYIDLKQIAATIYDAFYNNDLLGFTEDEDRAIAAVNNVPKTMIPQLSGIYKTNHKKDLSYDFIRFLNSTDYPKVAAKFN
jgi:hypothetical protein